MAFCLKMLTPSADRDQQKTACLNIKSNRYGSNDINAGLFTIHISHSSQRIVTYFSVTGLCAIWRF